MPEANWSRAVAQCSCEPKGQSDPLVGDWVSCLARQHPALPAARARPSFGSTTEPPDLGHCRGLVTTHRILYRCSLRIDHPTSQGRSDCGVDQHGKGAAVVQRTHRSDRNTEGAVIPDLVMPHGHPPNASGGRYRV